MKKADLLQHLGSVLEGKLDALNTELAATLEARNSDGKSSAGDKHEVGRAMVQQELDKLEEQRAKLMALQQELAKVPLERKYEQVAFGSLVTTDQGHYLIAIGLGAVEVEGEVIYAISLASPIGKVLAGKKVGDAIVFNGRSVVIRGIV